MKTNVALILFGVVALSTASHVRLRQNAVKSYGQSYGQPAPATPASEEYQEPAAEEPVQYKAAVKTVIKAPIRVTQDYSSSGHQYSHADRMENDRVADEQNRNAHYAFGSAIDDGIMDHSHVRQETRDGLKVEGSYAYSDGYFKRVVHYVADEGGYRVVKEEVEPISESGPKVDLVNGRAEVHTSIGGVDNQYSVSAQEIPTAKKLKE